MKEGLSSVKQIDQPMPFLPDYLIPSPNHSYRSQIIVEKK